MAEDRADVAATSSGAADARFGVELPAPDAPTGLSREWDIAAIPYHQVTALLDQGWEPFTVVQTYGMSQATVYLRRKVDPDA